MAAFEHHSGELPWGWWLRADAMGLRDEQGRRWNSVRDAFWQGRLGFPPVHFAPEQQELMLRVLTANAFGWHGARESCNDLFKGDMMFWRFYQCWLASIGMLDRGPGEDPLHARVSAEGRSVLMMLQATRQPEWQSLPLADILAVIAAERGPDAEARERALAAFEREVGFRRNVFARERVGNNYVVTLTGIAVHANMPTRRVVWSQSFADAASRDRMFAWLARRVNRWDDWADMAYRRGADALLSHLLRMVMGGSTDVAHPDTDTAAKS